jgi:hypothetical protein
VVGDGVPNVNGPTASLVGLWADAVALQRAGSAIAVRPGADDDLRLTMAAGDCGEAANEIQRAYPDVFRLTDVPTVADDIDRVSTAEGTERLLTAIAAVRHDFDIDNPALLQPKCSLPAPPRPGSVLHATRSAVDSRERRSRQDRSRG